MKQCSTCKRWREETDFFRDKGRRDGFMGQCKECAAQQKRVYVRQPGVREKRNAAERKRYASSAEYRSRQCARARKRYASSAEYRSRQCAMARERYAATDRAEPVVYRPVHLLASARARSTARAQPCTITVDWLRQVLAPMRCTYCARSVVFGRGSARPNSASLDRLDPTDGYTPENTVVACMQCNMRKSDASAAELRALADAIDLAIFARLP